jgi:hypothetical protein
LIAAIVQGLALSFKHSLVTPTSVVGFSNTFFIKQFFAVPFNFLSVLFASQSALATLVFASFSHFFIILFLASQASFLFAALASQPANNHVNLTGLLGKNVIGKGYITVCC